MVGELAVIVIGDGMHPVLVRREATSDGFTHQRKGDGGYKLTPSAEEKFLYRSMGAD
jgi:hypothetical protein